MIKAPWTQEQVDALNAWQKLGYVHEFTCPMDHPDDRVLTATPAGWICPSCSYTQNWAHDHMADKSQHQPPLTMTYPEGVHRIRVPKPVQWKPVADITAHELALAMPTLLGMVTSAPFDIEDDVNALPENVRRHFHIYGGLPE